MSTPQAGGLAAGEPLSRVSGRNWGAAVLYVAAAAMLLRFYDLPLKPLHHDEGVNTLFLVNLVQPPHTYKYDPTNYHGPTLYYFGWLAAFLLDLTTVAIRVVPAVAGMLTVLAFMMLRSTIGVVGALAAASLFALSPGAVYISRYFIHEMLLVCFTVYAVVLTQLWSQRRRALHLAGAAAAAALAFATKETALISSGVLAIAAVSSSVVVTLPAWLDGGAPNRTAMLLPGAFATVVRNGFTAVRRSPHPLLLGVAAVIFVAVNVLFYSSFLTHWPGVADALRSFAIWTGTGTSAHVHPWHTYIRWMTAEELPLLALGSVGAAHALWRRPNRFLVFSALWAIGTFAAYTLIPYKTPWLAVNILAPLAICAGHACEVAWRTGGRHRSALAAAAAVVALGSAYQSIVLNFREYDDDRHPYVYAHTSREVLALVDEVSRLHSANRSLTVAITSPDYFPLTWYFRQYRVGYYGKPVVTGDPLVIASEDQEIVLDILLAGKYQQLGVYKLRPGVRLVLYARKDLHGLARP